MAPMSPAAGGPGSLGPAASAVLDRLRRQIVAGELAPGERLGAEREIAARLNVSRSTVRAALADLERSGAVRRVRGRAGGIFVAQRKIERDLTSLSGLPAYLRRQGFQSDARVISTATMEADETIAATFGIPAGALVFEVVRVRLANGDPISLERAILPADQFPDLLDRSLSGSLYELLQSHYDLEPGEAEERIEVVAAAAAQARLLGVSTGAPLVAIERTAWSAGGVAFEHSHDLFRGDRVRIWSAPTPRRRPRVWSRRRSKCSDDPARAPRRPAAAPGAFTPDRDPG